MVSLTSFLERIEIHTDFRDRLNYSNYRTHTAEGPAGRRNVRYLFVLVKSWHS